jgi:hypothetical protein
MSSGESRSLGDQRISSQEVPAKPQPGNGTQVALPGETLPRGGALSETLAAIDAGGHGLDQGYVHRLRVAGKTYPVATLALALMLAAILLPSAQYSITMRNPSPAELLTAICISLFSGVLSLWILDATSVLRFRSQWVSRSVWGAAIASVLGTSVGVYKDAFSPQRMPLEGSWDLRLHKADQPEFEMAYAAVLAFSTRSGAYYGYSDFKANSDALGVVSVAIEDLDPKTGELRASLIRKDGGRDVVRSQLSTERDGKRMTSSSAGWRVEMSRPR